MTDGQLRGSAGAVRFGSVADLEAWYDAHHDGRSELWVAVPTRGTAAESVSRAEALDVALCYGWIDGLARSSDTPDGWWAQRFSPRRPHSTWSRRNRDRAMELDRLGRMRAPGTAAVERARAAGIWDAAYAPASEATTPTDLADALGSVLGAAEAYEALPAGRRYDIIRSVETARTLAGRRRRIERHVSDLGVPRRPDE